jgi:hypothetical protein
LLEQPGAFDALGEDTNEARRRGDVVAPPEGFALAVTAFQGALTTGGLPAVEALLEERSLEQSAATRDATRS